MQPQHPVVIQEGRGPRRTLVYLLHVGDSKPSQRYPLGTFDAVRDACGPDPCVVVRGDDGTAGALPVADAANKAVRRDVAEEFDVARIVVGGWSAGVRGIRRFLSAQHSPDVLWVAERLAGVVACDGLHAPWAVRATALARALEQPARESSRPTPLPLGPSDVFRAYVELARGGDGCPSCADAGTYEAHRCPGCGGSGWRYPLAFVLTHCGQDYMEAPSAKPRYLSTQTVARELTGFACRPTDDATYTAYEEGRLRVYSYPGPRVDYAGHVRQLREALPLGLRAMREWGLFAP